MMDSSLLGVRAACVLFIWAVIVLFTGNGGKTRLDVEKG